MDERVILCSNDGCIHNSGSGYYGLCQHPDYRVLLNTNGDRSYFEKCFLMEVTPDAD